MTERKTLVFTSTTLSKFLGDALLSLAYMRSRPEQVIRLLIHNGATRLHFQTRFDLFRCVLPIEYITCAVDIEDTFCAVNHLTAHIL